MIYRLFFTSHLTTSSQKTAADCRNLLIHTVQKSQQYKHNPGVSLGFSDGLPYKSFILASCEFLYSTEKDTFPTPLKNNPRACLYNKNIAKKNKGSDWRAHIRDKYAQRDLVKPS